MELSLHTSMALVKQQSETAVNTQKLIKSQLKIQKGEQTKFKFQKVKLCDFSLLIFGIFNCFFSVLYYQADYIEKTKTAMVFLHFSDGITFLFTLICIMRYRFQLQLQKSQKIIHQSETIYSSGKLWNLFVQLGVFYCQPYSFLHDIKFNTYNIYDRFWFDYKINYLLISFGFNKIYLLIRFALINQLYLNPRSNRLCRMYGTSADYLYAIKCLFKDRPLILISLTLGISFCNFCISLRICERGLEKQYHKHFAEGKYPPIINTFDDSFWFSVSTIISVGFGDFFPRTMMGRVVTVILVLWGTIIISLLIVSLTNTLNMDDTEKRALIVLNRLQTKKQLKEAAAFIITLCCRRFVKNKKGIKNCFKTKQSEDNQFQQKYRKYLLNFRSIEHSIGSMYQLDDMHQQMTRQFQIMEDQIKAILENQKNVLIRLNPKYKTEYSFIQRNYKRTEGLQKIILNKNIYQYVSQNVDTSSSTKLTKN